MVNNFAHETKSHTMEFSTCGVVGAQRVSDFRASKILDFHIGMFNLYFTILLYNIHNNVVLLIMKILTINENESKTTYTVYLQLKVSDQNYMTQAHIPFDTMILLF